LALNATFGIEDLLFLPAPRLSIFSKKIILRVEKCKKQNNLVNKKALLFTLVFVGVFFNAPSIYYSLSVCHAPLQDQIQPAPEKLES
jgi:hypothetical protein